MDPEEEELLEEDEDCWALEAFLTRRLRQLAGPVTLTFGARVQQDWGSWRDLQPGPGRALLESLQSSVLAFACTGLARGPWSQLRMAAPHMTTSLEDDVEEATSSTGVRTVSSFSGGAVRFLTPSRGSSVVVRAPVRMPFS
mgnify:CR=1 FL=1